MNVGAGIGAFVLVLVLVNNNMPDTTKFALIVGLIAAVAIKKVAAPAAGHH
jgi:hypothetical protein